MSVDKNKRKDFIKAPHTHFYSITLFQFNKEIFDPILTSFKIVINAPYMPKTYLELDYCE